MVTNSKARSLSLSLPLQKGKITSEQVYNYFDNLLPDPQLVCERIVKRFKAVSTQPFDLLSEIGRDTIGAITLLPYYPITLLPYYLNPSRKHPHRQKTAYCHMQH